MDPFLGLGSTAIACARLGIDFAGIEMTSYLSLPVRIGPAHEGASKESTARL